MSASSGTPAGSGLPWATSGAPAVSAGTRAEDVRAVNAIERRIDDVSPALPSVASDSISSEILSILPETRSMEGIETQLAETLDMTTGAFSADKLLPDSEVLFKELESFSSGTKTVRRISIVNAVCRAIEVNQSLSIERLRPEVSNTGIMAAESQFDTNLDMGVTHTTRHIPTLGAQRTDSNSTAPRVAGEAVTRTDDFNVGLSGRLPTGTNYSFGFDATRTSTNHTFPFYTSSLNAGLTQNLLKGAGCAVNCARVWTAEHNFIISLYQLQQVLINLVTDVQNAYWDLYLSLATLEIRRSAYEVAKEQRERTEEFVRVGKSPPLELLAAQAEESARFGDIITGVALVKERELLFLRLINPDNLPQSWDTRFYPADTLVLPDEKLNVRERVSLANYYRPDLRQAQLDLANGELEVMRTTNGLLPSLDFVGSLTYNGAGDTLGQPVRQIRDREYPSWQVGLQLSYPLQNRAARAEFRRANFQRQIAEESIKNFCQIIEVDVRSAIIEIERTARLINSTLITRQLREAELAAEIEKFRVGRSTALLVNQAQRDLTQARLDEISSVVANIKAYIALYRFEGTSLQRNGIQPVMVTEASGVSKD